MKQILFSLSFLSFVFTYGQKPMSRAYILTKVDSIQREANFLFFIKSSIDDAKKKINKNETVYNYYTINYNDTLKIIFTNKDSKFISKVIYIYSKKTPISYEDNFRVLTKFEDSLIASQNKMRERINNETDFSNFGDSYSDEIFIYTPSFIKVFQLRYSNDSELIPFGGDFLYLFSHSYKLNLKKELYKNNSKKVDRNTAMIILVYNQNIPFINSSDIFKFLYYKNRCILDQFTAYSPRNRQNFTYNSKENNITVHY